MKMYKLKESIRDNFDIGIWSSELSVGEWQQQFRLNINALEEVKEIRIDIVEYPNSSNKQMDIFLSKTGLYDWTEEERKDIEWLLNLDIEQKNELKKQKK